MSTTRKCWVLVSFLSFIFSVFGSTLRSNVVCAPRSTVESALRRGEQVVASSLKPAEADWLVDGLRLRMRARGNYLCFTRQDFTTFGHILATVIARDMTNPSTSDSSIEQSRLENPLTRVANFARPSHSANSVTSQGNNCSCDCKPGAEGWCGGPVPVCCAKYCTSIFKAIAVGALAALFEDGHSACCRDSAYKCTNPDPFKSSHKSSGSTQKIVAASKSPAPEFQFKLPEEKRTGLSSPHLDAGNLTLGPDATAVPVSTAIPVALPHNSQLHESTTPTTPIQLPSISPQPSMANEIIIQENEIVTPTSLPT